jgi:phosphoribosyl 1,2-cyclic phosphodiesterase
MTRDAGLLFRFWGVRGSVPTPGPRTVRYGGNTPCIEIRAGEHLLIFDGGTGLRCMGEEIVRIGKPVSAHLFLTHMHWDHIQGIPFFAPAFMPGNAFTFYGEEKGGQTIREILERQMTDPNFPVPLSIMQSVLAFEPMTAGAKFEVAPGLVVSTAALNHPNGCLALRIDYNDRALVYATDTEHAPSGPDPVLVEFARGAEVLIHDAMYTVEEYETGKRGWGHATYQAAVEVAQAAQVQRLYFFHHDPDHDDAFLDARLAEMRGCLVGDPLVVEMAREGETGAI